MKYNNILNNIDSVVEVEFETTGYGRGGEGEVTGRAFCNRER